MRQILLKVHSRCNLSCTYCYIYEGADDSWRAQPRRMTLDTVKHAVVRMSEHASRHAITQFTVIMHGGEPLLAGADFIDVAARMIRDGLPPKVRVDLHIQTNGILLNKDFLRVFERHRIRVGVSLDGGERANARRRYANGSPSYAKAAAAINVLSRYPELYSGILVTVDVANPPSEVYRDLLGFKPPRLDFNLPHRTWDSPPPGHVPGLVDTPYANWLIEVFDLWYEAKPPPTRIGLFESLLSLMLGGDSYTEVLGLHPIDLLTVETDGSIEQSDVLKVVERGAAATGMHVATHSFDSVMNSPGIMARRLGVQALGVECQRCELVRVCGGGHYAHRFKDGHFRNPSVYCADLAKLIRHVRARMLDDLRPAVKTTKT